MNALAKHLSALSLPVLALLAGCATAPVGPAKDVSSDVGKSIGAEPYWLRSGAAQAFSEARVPQFNGEPLMHQRQRNW